jgi:hypothetical protein
MTACWEWPRHHDPRTEIEEVMNDTNLNAISLGAIREEINLDNYEFSWQPNEDDITTIKVRRIFPIYVGNKDCIFKEIFIVVYVVIRMRTVLFRHLRLEE